MCGSCHCWRRRLFVGNGQVVELEVGEVEGRGGVQVACESLSLLDSPDIGTTSSISSLKRSAAELYSNVGEGSKERVLAMELSKLARAPVS